MVLLLLCFILNLMAISEGRFNGATIFCVTSLKGGGGGEGGLNLVGFIIEIL